jgi:DDE domain
LKPIRICTSKYLNNRIEQDHRRIKRRVHPMLGYKASRPATATLAGIEMVHMMRKGQDRFAWRTIPLMVGPAAKRDAVAHLKAVMGLSERRACQIYLLVLTSLWRRSPMAYPNRLGWPGQG